MSPWIHSGTDLQRLCLLWNKVYYAKYGLISRNCFNCWKTVCGIDSINHLFMMQLVQRDLFEEFEYIGKCGAEMRPEGRPHHIYFAVWYNRLTEGLVEARLRTKRIEERVHKDISPNLEVNLKRACTHMEQRAGRSHTWKYPKEQHLFEDQLDDLFDIGRAVSTQSDVLKRHIHRTWLEHGLQSRDPDIQRYVDKYPEGFGLVPMDDYYHNSPNLESGIVKEGKLGEARIQRV